MTSNEYLYGCDLFGDDEAVMLYYERKKAAAKRLLEELLDVPLARRDTLRINKATKAAAWCQARIDEIRESFRSRSEQSEEE